MKFASTLVTSVILVLSIAAAGYQVAFASGSTECTVAALQATAPNGTTITGARTIPPSGGLPEYCQVDGHVATPGNTVNFRLGLPANWNGKYYFVGVGGLGGTIGSLNAGLVRGYASASTDTGHTAADHSWETNHAAKIDYGHRGTHVTAVAAKALTASYFGEQPRHSYFNGCSNGGRQAQMEVQRYPEDFDGIIAGDPSPGTPLQVGRVLVFQQMLLQPDYYLPQEKVELLSKAAAAACDVADGLKDGLGSDPRLCTFTPESLKCSGADGPNCLTQPQVETVKKIYAPVKLPDGQIYAYGLPVGHEGSPTGWQAWTIGRVPPAKQADGTLAFGDVMPNSFLFSEANVRFLGLEKSDPAFNWKTFKFPQDLARIQGMAKELSPSDPNLTPFKNRGGKIIYYHGWADPAISAYGTIDYYEKMTKAVGGPQQADSFARLYLAPGMHHCSGGPGPNSFDMLPVLEAWVERSVAPTQVIASHMADGKVSRTRPLCPYPQVAQYTGSGSIDDAANFRCVVPK